MSGPILFHVKPRSETVTAGHVKQRAGAGGEARGRYQRQDDNGGECGQYAVIHCRAERIDASRR